MKIIRKIERGLLSNLNYIRIIILILTNVTAIFVDKGNNWHYWSWKIYFVVSVIYLLIEYIDHRNKKMTPIERFKQYLLDDEGWHKNDDAFYYEPSPEYKIKLSECDDNHLDFTQEWTRGEIGYHYSTGNCAYYAALYYYETCLKKLHIVTFDGGKKTIIAPDWSQMGRGRFYFYIDKTIEYAYQKFLSKLYGEDFSKNLRKTNNGEGKLFSIPVFKTDNDKQRFLEQFKNGSCEPETNKDEQNKLFYDLIEKYHEYRKA